MQMSRSLLFTEDVASNATESSINYSASHCSSTLHILHPHFPANMCSAAPLASMDKTDMTLSDCEGCGRGGAERASEDLVFSSLLLSLFTPLLFPLGRIMFSQFAHVPSPVSRAHNISNNRAITVLSFYL